MYLISVTAVSQYIIKCVRERTKYSHLNKYNFTIDQQFCSQYVVIKLKPEFMFTELLQ